MSDNSWRHIGVDWDSGSWVAVGYTDDGTVSAAVYDTIETLWNKHSDTAERIVVDIPIGLCGKGELGGCVKTDGELSRRCDDLARSVIGPRSSSIFTAPCRKAVKKAVNGATYDEINRTNKEQTGKGLMQQAASIAPGINEVEEVLQNNGDSEKLLEGHPEVCFRALADRNLEYSKKTAPGMAERLSALERTSDYEEGTWRSLADTLGETGGAVGTDDLIDALSLALTAKASEDEFYTLPEDPPTDAENLPMQMVYRRSEPFDIG